MQFGLIEHHIKYKEIDGADETVWMSPSEHRKLHNNLRKTGQLNVPPTTLHKIARLANLRTEKGKKYRYNYEKNQRTQIFFKETLAPNVLLVEELCINKNTGTITINSYFIGNNRQSLFVGDL